MVGSWAKVLPLKPSGGGRCPSNVAAQLGESPDPDVSPSALGVALEVASSTREVSPNVSASVSRPVRTASESPEVATAGGGPLVSPTLGLEGESGAVAPELPSFETAALETAALETAALETAALETDSDGATDAADVRLAPVVALRAGAEFTPAEFCGAVVHCRQPLTASAVNTRRDVDCVVEPRGALRAGTAVPRTASHACHANQTKPTTFMPLLDAAAAYHDRRSCRFLKSQDSAKAAALRRDLASRRSLGRVIVSLPGQIAAGGAAQNSSGALRILDFSSEPHIDFRRGFASTHELG